MSMHLFLQSNRGRSLSLKFKYKSGTFNLEIFMIMPGTCMIFPRTSKHQRDVNNAYSWAGNSSEVSNLSGQISLLVFLIKVILLRRIQLGTQTHQAWPA